VIHKLVKVWYVAQAQANAKMKEGWVIMYHKWCAEFIRKPTRGRTYHITTNRCACSAVKELVHLINSTLSEQPYGDTADAVQR
jgi:hypothetical protein